jgi:hypothetical protein
MGNTVLWKPASTSILSNYYLFKLLEAAGLPPGVVNFVPGRGASVGDPVFASPEFAGLHFTGSTATFQGMWKTISGNLPSYKATRASSARPAARTSSSRTRRPTSGRWSWRWCAAPSSTRARSARPPRAPTCRSPLEARSREDLRAELAAIEAWARRPTSATSWRGDRRGVVRQHLGYVEHAKRSNDAEIVFGGEGDNDSGLLRPADGRARQRPEAEADVRRDLRPRADDPRLRRQRSSTKRSSSATRPRPTRSPARSSPRTAPRSAMTKRCATPPATSTSTTSRPVRWSASSRSAAAAPRAPTTRPARSEPGALGLDAHDQGELRAADGGRLPAPGRRVSVVAYRTRTSLPA